MATRIITAVIGLAIAVVIMFFSHTIVFNKEKRLPVIVYDKCIKCFCCQELCPADAVKIKQNILVRIIH